MKNKKKTLIVIGLLLILSLTVLVSYIKFSDNSNNETKNPKKNNPTEEQENDDNNIQPIDLDINSSLVRNLVYPKANSYGYAGNGEWNWIDTDLKTLGRALMMESAAMDIHRDNGDNTYFVLAEELKDNFIKMFGPDTEYTDGKIKEWACLSLSTYDEIKKEYFIDGRCGGLDVKPQYEIRLYNANQVDDEIHIYYYVQPYFNNPNDEQVYLYDRIDSFDFDWNNGKNSGYDKIIESENEIQTMMDKGEVDTYKFTFKKQSDGNYYFYNGEWQ